MILLKPKEAAEYIKMSTNTLATWRHQGRGPSFIKTGRTVKYSRDDMDKWMKENLFTAGKKNRAAARNNKTK
jgi:excisionase family DNA binding protein